jgi:hypothetical protein
MLNFFLRLEQTIKDSLYTTEAKIFILIVIVGAIGSFIYLSKSDKNDGQGPKGTGTPTGKKRELPRWLTERNRKFAEQTS